jgi:hypothetical protein
VLHLLDFIEDDTARLSDPEQSYDCRNNNQETQQSPIGAWKIENVMVLHALRSIALKLLFLLLVASIRCGRPRGRPCR